MSPNMGKPMGDLAMGMKPVAWDEPRTAADVTDLEAGLGGQAHSFIPRSQQRPR
jgi:palmitoyltransferase ZDHHC9/14/18